ncbi:MAG TPA: carbon-nitrogen hydrolase family protein [Kribbella sp.]|nr:carbon-nitrogen hydrolase family protein [Kribbella sp.]
MTTVRAVVVQAGSVLFDTPATLDRLDEWCAKVAEHEPGIVVFPEGFVGGYPKGLDFGARIGSRTADGRADYQRYWEAAIDVPGPEFDRLAAAAASLRATLVVGVIERVGRTLYCTALTIGPDGTLLATHRKLMPTAMERLVWGFGDGSTMGVTSTPAGRVGVAICWENYMPMYRMSQYADGVEVWCAPTVDDREIWQSTMRHIGVEGRCFVLSACQYLTRADAPEDYACVQGNDPATVLIGGGSMIVSPMGEVLAGPLRDAPGLLVADLDLGLIAQGKYDLDVAGHYARPDVFHLHVDRSPKPPVT